MAPADARIRRAERSLAYPPGVEPEIRVLAHRVLAQQIRHLSALLGQAHEQVEDPSAHTPARADLNHINHHPEKSNLLGLRWWADRAAVYNLSAAEEHLTGVGIVLAADRLLPLPAMALARSVYEAVINTCWLIDVEVPIEQRLARWAGRLLHDGQEPTSALDTFGEAAAVKEERDRATDARGLGQDLMTRAGFGLRAKGGNRFEETARVTYRGESSSLTPNVTELVERFSPASNLWHMFSGATHSRGWLISGLEGPETEVITSVIAPLLDTSDTLTYEISRYFGLDPRPTIRQTHMHRTAILRLARPSDSPIAGVDQYRKASGLPPLPKPVTDAL